jgi:small subunit ribosomal protein S6
MPGYETTVVLRPNVTDDQAASMRSKMETIIKADGGELLNQEDWGSRRLAFMRKRESKGRYFYFAYTGKTSSVAELERNLRINENVILYLSVRRNEGESEEELAALKDTSSMLKARERAKREGFGADMGVERPSFRNREEGGRPSYRDRDEGPKFSKE